MKIQVVCHLAGGSSGSGLDFNNSNYNIDNANLNSTAHLCIKYIIVFIVRWMMA